MRERAGLSPDGAVGEGSLATIKENLLGKNQLKGSEFPKIAYTASACRLVEGSAGRGRVEVTGDLTIRGTTQPVEVTMNVTADGSTFAAKGSTTLLQTSFGFKPFSNLAGALKNKDALKLVIDVVGASSAP